MTREQRTELAVRLRQPHPAGPPPSIGDLRAGFRALMGGMLVPEAIRTTPTTLGPRPALLVEPAGPANGGTILYFHGGGFVVGSPETALSLTGNLVTRTNVRAGVDVILDVTAGVPHVFQSFAGALDEAGEALDRAALFLAQRLAPTGAPARDRTAISR
jgi:hypothetical protein